MRKTLSTLAIIVLGLSAAFAQQAVTSTATDTVNGKVYTIVQQMPTFKNGDIYQYLGKHIKYPTRERRKNITGTVYVTFVVEKDGSITGVKVIKGIPNGPGLDKEAVKVISRMPKWAPGMQNGKAVRVQYNIPISFMLK